MKLSVCSIMVLAGLVTALSPRARALPDGEAVTGRLIANQYADAIVAVKGTALMRITVGDRAMPPREEKFDVNGTVITPTGLTVASLSGIDLKAAFESLRAQFKAGAQAVEFGKTEFKALRFRLMDGTEIPATFAWRDEQHDLAFIAPTDETVASRRPFTYVNLNEAPPAAKVLGDYYQLSRASDALQRVLLVRACTLNGIMERPQRLLIANTESYPDVVGCPIFDPQGRVLGVCLHYMDNGQPKGTIVLPAVDIAAAVVKSMSPR